MNRQEFVAEIARRTNLNRHDADRSVQAVLDTITDQLKRGGEVSFTGFGKFHVAERGPRQGVNPRTGERITIPGGKVPKFSAGAGLKSAVKGS